MWAQGGHGTSFTVAVAGCSSPSPSVPAAAASVGDAADCTASFAVSARISCSRQTPTRPNQMKENRSVWCPYQTATATPRYLLSIQGPFLLPREFNRRVRPTQPPHPVTHLEPGVLPRESLRLVHLAYLVVALVQQPVHMRSARLQRLDLWREERLCRLRETILDIRAPVTHSESLLALQPRYPTGGAHTRSTSLPVQVHRISHSQPPGEGCFGFGQGFP
jgi:hypothetical protein